MNIELCGKGYKFRPWRPTDGKVFDKTFAFDCETALIDEEQPWLTPAFVLGAASDGTSGYFVRREHVKDFFAAHEGSEIVFHHAAFDLRVVHFLAPSFDIYRWVDQDLIWDTQLLYRLHVLGTKGHTASRKGESTLERCAQDCLRIHLPKDVLDSKGKVVRLSYGQWLNQPAQEIEPVYLEYLAKDAVVTFQLFRRLRCLLREMLDTSGKAWGYVSPEWLRNQERRWGPQTHHIQLRASIVLDEIAANGLTLDLDRKQELTAQLESVLNAKRQELRGYGYIPGQKGSDTALQGILKRLERQYPEVDFPRTPTGKYSTSREAVGELAGVIPFFGTLFEHTAVETLLNSFLDKMERKVIHPHPPLVQCPRPDWPNNVLRRNQCAKPASRRQGSRLYRAVRGLPVPQSRLRHHRDGRAGPGHTRPVWPPLPYGRGN